MAQQVSTNTFGVAKWIVSSTASDGTHTTIAAALTSASSGDTIIIRPGTYTENLTLKAGINLSAFDCDAMNGNVTIAGTCTFTAAGTVDISGIRLQTNSAALLAVTGAATSIVNLRNCYLNISNNTAITYSSSDANSAINLFNCYGDMGTTGIAIFTHTSAGSLNFFHSFIQNTGASTTASTCSAGSVTLHWTEVKNPITTSSTGGVGVYNSIINTGGQNATCLTAGGSGGSGSTGSTYFSGTASAISISVGAAFIIASCSISSSNTNAITGAGGISFTGLSFTGTSSTINTTTQTIAGTLQGSKVSAPTAGMLGEVISSNIVTGSAVTLSNNTSKTVTSISLTAGVFDVSGMVVLNGVLTGTRFQGGTSATADTLGASGVGIDTFDTPTMSTAAAGVSQCVPPNRVVVTATTTYYLVARAAFTVGTATASGRLTATRVG